jgi:16S rRNA (guanine527-N7)-methyltransferase
VGSGNGVPGLVWAVVLPAARVVLVERVARKAAFLRHAVARLGLRGRVGVYQESVQANGDLLKAMPPGGYAIIGSRAFAAIEDFLSLSWCHSGAATQWLYMAGRLDEIRGLKTSMYTHPTTPMRYELDAVESASDDGHPGGRHLVWIRRAQG